MAIEAVAQSAPLQSSAQAPKPSVDQDKQSASVSLDSGKTGGSATEASQTDGGRLVDVYA
ncbi:MAG: hypothetical protein HOM25_20860 [Rhodospirillaceae bacterium]|nr:hypothetical protein [Rhodospirillaceae bacterium]MBT5664993.1 hypothetical protein [Rhodospirillaceae bacterium]MBT5809852.1 hypothetical protein [Rhodospirillaceae bacterium]